MRVGIIGGGAAGIMSALFACKRGNEVTVIEHNDRLLKKILSTGNGKCNFTNINMELQHYHGNKEAMKYIDRFNQYDTIRFFNEVGVLEYIRDGYVYPNSEQAASIRNALLIALKDYNPEILLNSEIIDVGRKDNKFIISLYESKQLKKLKFDKIIIATGLGAAPKLGSDASFLNILSKLGIEYNKYLPALCSLELDKRDFFNTVTGVRAKGEISVYIKGERIAGDFGELQFGDTGISGIPTFQISRYVSRALDKGQKVTVKTDMFSHIGDIKEIINKRKKIFKPETLGDFGNGLINSKLWFGILKLAGKNSENKVKSCDEKNWNDIIKACKNMEFKVLKTADFDKCQVCTGGISLKKLDNNLMYKDMRNLHFAGEIIDVDGICGGYNLQWAWTSGYIAGNA